MGAFDDLPAARSAADPFGDLPGKSEGPGFVENLRSDPRSGLIEAGANVITGMAGQAAGGVTALATGDPGAVEPVAEAITYQPRTSAGKELAEGVQYPFQKWEEFADWSGDKALALGATPAQAAALKTTLMFPPFVKGKRGAGAARPSPEPAAEPVAQPAPAPLPERPFPIPPAETSAVRPEGKLTRTKPEPGAEVVGAEADPFADLPDAGDLSKVLPLPEEVRGVPTRETLEAEARSKSGLLPGEERMAESERVLAEPEPAPEPKRLKRSNANPVPLLTRIKRMGGISSKELLDLTGESRGTVRPGLFSKAGNPLDDLATRLRDEGFDIPQDSADGGVQALRNMIQDELNGRKKHYSFEDQDRAMEMEWERISKESVEESTLGEDSVLTGEQADKPYGPGTLGMNPMLDPAAIKRGVEAVGSTAQEVLSNTLGVPGKDRNLLSPILREEQYRVAQADRWAAGEGDVVRKAFPKPKDREALTLALVRGDFSGLTGEQLAVAQRLKQNYAQAGQYLLDTKAIAGLRTNYSPQIWDTRDPHTKKMIEMWREARDRGPIREDSPLVRERGGSGTFSPFLLERAIENVEEGMKLGLKPASMDAAALFETYIRSTVRAVERGKAFKSLGELMSDDGVPIQMPTKQAPSDYVSIRNPEFEGYRFHPDAAPAIKVAYETDNPWIISKALQMAAYASKRGLMSYSLFHPTSLALAWEGTLPTGRIFNPKGAIDAALKKYREGGPGDTVDKLLREGLKIGVPMEDLVGRERFTQILDKMEGVLDRAGAGAITRIPRKVDRALQYATWDYLQTGFKLDIGTRLADLKIAQNLERIAKGEIKEEAIYRQVAESVNGFQGGVNWERMIEKFDTPVGRKIMQEVLSKSGRRWMQTFLLAPDWLVSTVSTWTNAVTGGEAAAIRQQLARRYLLTSAIITYTYGNALNYYFTGHSMFENKSNKKNANALDDLKAKTEIQLRDGRHINPNKHFLEVPHAVADPVGFGLNKLSSTIKEPVEQIANRQYLSTGYAPPITDKRDSQMKALRKRAAHAAGKVVPITARSITDQGPAGFGGFFGFPVSGVSDEQKLREKQQRDIDRAMGR